MDHSKFIQERQSMIYLGIFRFKVHGYATKHSPLYQFENNYLQIHDISSTIS